MPEEYAPLPTGPRGGYAAALYDDPSGAVGDLGSFDARNAGAGSDYFARVNKIFAASLRWPRTGPAWSFRDMMVRRKVIANLRALQNLPPREMIERAQQRADSAQAALLARVRRYIERRFTDQVRDGLLAGVAIAAAVGGLAAAAGASGPFALAVAAVGLVVGFILGLIDWNGIQIRDTWARVLDAMTPLERYFTLAGFKSTSDQIRADLHKAALEPWRIVDGDRHARENIVVESLEATTVRHCLPEPPNDVDKAGMALWFAAAISNYRPARDPHISDTWAQWARIERIVHGDGRIELRPLPAQGVAGINNTPDGGQWVRPWLAPLARYSAAELVEFAADPAGFPAAQGLRKFRVQNGRLETLDMSNIFAPRLETLTTEQAVRDFFARGNRYARTPPMRDLADCPFSREFMARYESEIRELTS